MAAFCSFPSSHGPRGWSLTSVQLGPKARGLEVGPAGGAQPVAVLAGRAASNRPAPACRKRALQPVLELLRRRHQTGDPHRGLGRCGPAATPSLMPAHDSMLFPSARFGGPTSLAVFRRPVFRCRCTPSPGNPPAAFQAGSWSTAPAHWGLCALAILRALYPDAGRGGGGPGSKPRPSWHADSAPSIVLAHEPRLAVIEELVAWGGGRFVAAACKGCRWRIRALSTLSMTPSGSRRRFEVGVRVLAARGTLVKAGVHAPGRWEWSPLYFKEIKLGRQQCICRRGSRRASPARDRALPRPGGRRSNRPAFPC